MKKIGVRAYPAIMGIGLSVNKNKILTFINLKGEIKIYSNKSKKAAKIINFPFIRGFLLFFVGIYEFLYFLSQSSRFAEAGSDADGLDNNVGKKLNVSASSVFWALYVVATLFVGLFVLAIVPDLIGSTLNQSVQPIFRNMLVGAVKLTLFYAIVCLLKLVPSMKTFYRYNGAINKCLSYPPQDIRKLNVEKVKENSINLTTNFLTFVIFVFAVHFFVISLIGLRVHFALEILLNIAIFCALTGICYEFLKLFERRKLIISKFVSMIICWPTTSKPTHTELETCIGGLFELDQMNLTLNREPTNVAESENFATSSVLCEVKNALAKAGINDESDAEWLVATVLGVNRTALKLTPQITPNELKLIRDALNKRISHMPISKIFGWTEFYGLKMIVDKNVLSPRPETELVCEEAIKLINKNGMKSCLDLCTGSGAIAIAIAKNTDALVTASDISKSALKIADKNAKANDAKIKIVESNLFSDLKKNAKFDIIISNPPYIPSAEIALLDEEVKNFDPHIALDGGEDGLSFYKKICQKCPEHLKTGGYLVLEIGNTQGEQIKKILKENFEKITVKKDYSGLDRIVVAKLKENK